jgi:hypothetical protein
MTGIPSASKEWTEGVLGDNCKGDFDPKWMRCVERTSSVNI